MSAGNLLKLSLNEVETALRKVALGEGWPFPLAEEFGMAAAWLCARKEDGVGIALAAVTAYAPLPLPSTGEAWRFPAAPTGLIAAQAAACLLDDGRPVELSESDAPLMALASVGVALSNTPDKAVQWRDDAGRDGLVGAYGLFAPNGTPADTLRLERTDAAPPSATAATRAVCAETVWREVERRAVLAYVPSSAASRAGAGAGDTDND